MMLQKMFIIVVLMVFFYVNIEGQFGQLSNPNGKQSIVRSNDDPGDALFLTPYIEQGKIKEARRLR
jgi:hypothetical protein